MKTLAKTEKIDIIEFVFLSISFMRNYFFSHFSSKILLCSVLLCLGLAFSGCTEKSQLEQPEVNLDDAVDGMQKPVQ